MKYYINGILILEEEIPLYIGETKEIIDYARKVYSKKLNISEIPEELQGTVSTIVENRNTRFGNIEDREVSLNQLAKMIQEVM